MSIPDAEVRIALAWCARLTPQEHADASRVEVDVSARHITIYESSHYPVDDAEPWIRVAVARLRYTTSSGLWTLYWADRNADFHVYRGRRPARRVQTLLDFVEHSGDPIFWG